jgi:hypothetical protein
MNNFNGRQPGLPDYAGEVPEIVPDVAPLPKIDPKWELHKDEIYRFYIEENHTLPSTISVFEQKYGLTAR